MLRPIGSLNYTFTKTWKIKPDSACNQERLKVYWLVIFGFFNQWAYCRTTYGRAFGNHICPWRSYTPTFVVNRIGNYIVRLCTSFIDKRINGDYQWNNFWIS